MVTPKTGINILVTPDTGVKILVTPKTGIKSLVTPNVARPGGDKNKCTLAQGGVHTWSGESQWGYDTFSTLSRRGMKHFENLILEVSTVSCKTG